MSDPSFPAPYPRFQRPAHREKPMKVLALGLSRTGTMSLYVALKKLGYTCYHMAECGRDAANDSLTLWHAAIDAKYYGKGRKIEGEDFDKMLWRYDAVTDIPCILFVDELLAAYPDAQIILTNRPVETWIPSIERTFYNILSWKRWAPLQLLDERVSHYIPILRSAPDIWTGGNWRDKTRLPEGYANHYAHVRAAAKAQGREVLEFQVQDGWKPLCEFLGKEMPDEPFPRVNEGDFAVKMQYTIFWIRTLFVVLRALKWTAPVAAAAGAWWWYNRR